MRKLVNINRGFCVYAGIVIAISLIGTAPVVAHDLNLIGRGTARLFIPVLGPPIAVAKFAPPVLAVIEWLMVGNNESLAVFGVLLLYYVLLLSPIGFALATTKGPLIEVRKRTMWLILQGVYLVFHVALVVGDYWFKWL